ncbi:MAG: zf-TFIIB domain-containing protein [Anaerolineae bacterium]
MLCPVCDVELVMSERKGVEIDYCPKCRGVWLDRGELDKIIDRSERHLNERSDGYRKEHRAESHQHDHGGYGKPKRDYRYKKRKSVIGEIFDIFD